MEELVLIAEATAAEEWQGLIIFLPCDTYEPKKAVSIAARVAHAHPLRS